MRFYDLKIFYPPQYPIDPSAPKNIFKQISSLKNGVFNPGCLMVEFDIQRFGESTPKGHSVISVWGLGPKEMQQARQDLFGMTVELWVGMSAGLPLANPKQQGLVMKGTIWQVLGNWQGTELRLDLVIVAGPVSQTDPMPMAPLNLTLPWNKGMKLSVALTQCFQMFGGGYGYNINVSERLINSFDSKMICSSLAELARQVNSLSKNIIRDSNYSGVEISVVNGNEFRAYDNDFANHSDSSTLSGPVRVSATGRRNNPKKIAFTDLIGQPTWVQYGKMAVPCVMRSDIQVGDYILMPEKLRPMIQASSYSQFRDDSAFTGVFFVSSVRLLGNSRQPDANAWVTILEAQVETGVTSQ